MSIGQRTTGGGRRAHPPTGAASALPAGSGGLGLRRHLAGAAVLLTGLPLLVAVLLPARSRLSVAVPALLVLLLVTAAAVVGGRGVAVPGAVGGALLLNWFFTPPYGTWQVDSPVHLVVLVVYLAVAVAVSWTVDLAARRTAEAGRARAEADAFSGLAEAAPSEDQSLADVLTRVRAVFGMREAQLLERGGEGWTSVESSGSGAAAPPGEVERRIPAGPDLVLVVRGPELFAADLRVLQSFADAAAHALQGRRLARRAAEAARLEATDRARSTLLAGVGHDLRTPLAAVKAAVSSLRQTDVAWTAEERQELLATIEDGADRLQRLVTDLLDASRLQAGVVPTLPERVGLEELLARALLSLPVTDRIDSRLPPDLPDVFVDVALAERILANLLENALRYSPAPGAVTVRATLCPPTDQGAVEGNAPVLCEVVDSGPGLPAAQWSAAFEPFQRLGSGGPGELGDRGSAGLGLGLAVARGFAEAIGGSLVPDRTPGGGLTMRLTLPAASRCSAPSGAERRRGHPAPP
jgi:two-component system sensor histidine kinase KdpD